MIGIDTVTISPQLVIQQQSIGVATRTKQFQGSDGILGIGPVDLTSDALSTKQLVPTVTDNLFSAGQIPYNLIGISYVPTSEVGQVNGELNFGATDQSKCVFFLPLPAIFG